jgi:exopolyphosphatase/pppGpp-phosphohydrolase
MRFVRTTLLMTTVLATLCSAQTKYFGGIDLGSKGTKAALFSAAHTSDGYDIELVFGKAINTKLVSSMKEGRFTDGGLQEATDAAKTLIDAMQAKAGEEKLANVTYYIVGSSGVAAGQNKEDLAAKVKEATSIEMTFIDAKTEGYLGMQSAVPSARLSTSMYIDIGSGNTKLGCLVGGSDMKNFKSDEIKYGSVSGRNAARELNHEDVVDGVQQLMKQVADKYATDSEDIPCLRNRQRIYWTGGAAWASATFMHPDKALSARVSITRHDLDAFLASLKDGTWNQRKPVLTFPKEMSTGRQAKIRARAESDRQDVMNVFVREDLLSGVSLMKTVLESSNPSASIVFGRESGFIYGVAVQKYLQDSETERASR